LNYPAGRLLTRALSAHSKTGKSYASQKQKTWRLVCLWKNKYLIYPFAIAQGEIQCSLSAKNQDITRFLYGEADIGDQSASSVPQLLKGKIKRKGLKKGKYPAVSRVKKSRYIKFLVQGV
jgi:hypothetical protein